MYHLIFYKGPYIYVCVCVCVRRQVEYVTYSALFTSISNPGHVTKKRTLKVSCLLYIIEIRTGHH